MGDHPHKYCDKGHLLEEPNIHWNCEGVSRECRICKLIRNKEWKRRKRNGNILIKENKTAK